MALGKCYRCKTVVEPFLSPQWFVKIQPLADPAIAAVEQGHVRIIPEEWSNNYLGWMRGIKDWCISRQIWWGHRIPAWYCTTCCPEARRILEGGGSHLIPTHAEPMVSEIAPATCTTCGQSRVHSGSRRARHVVFIGPLALFHLGLARKYQGPRDLLPDVHVGHGVGYPVLLGGTHDHDGHQVYRQASIP